MSKIRTAILDDHQLFRTGICEMVNKSEDFMIIASVGTPEELYEAMEAEAPDLLLLDLRLRDADGMDVLKKLKSSHPAVKVVMLTMHTEAPYVRRLIENGANGYLAKDITPDEFFKSIRNVMSLGCYYGPEIADVLIQSLQHKAHLKNLGIAFNEIEIDILKYISEGLTADAIADELNKSSRTIEGYRQRLLEKTDTKNTASLIAWAFKNGIL